MAPIHGLGQKVQHLPARCRMRHPSPVIQQKCFFRQLAIHPEELHPVCLDVAARREAKGQAFPACRLRRDTTASADGAASNRAPQVQSRTRGRTASAAGAASNRAPQGQSRTRERTASAAGAASNRARQAPARTRGRTASGAASVGDQDPRAGGRRRDRRRSCRCWNAPRRHQVQGDAPPRGPGAVPSGRHVRTGGFAAAAGAARTLSGACVAEVVAGAFARAALRAFAETPRSS